MRIAMLVLQHRERRMVEFRDLLRQDAVFPVFRLVRKLDVDAAHRIGRIVESHRESRVLFVRNNLRIDAGFASAPPQALPDWPGR